MPADRGDRHIRFWDLRKPEHHRRYKYRLDAGYTMDTGICPRRRLVIEPGGYVTLETNGWITIKAGYAWDGPSGPTIDSPSFMRASLVHDALYQLMREDLLNREYRDAADRLMRKMCRQDGMSKARAARVYWALKHFGAKHTERRPAPPLLKAP